MDAYYRWQLSFNKHTCEWLDLKYCLVADEGTGEWTHEENPIFCIFIFHSDIANDSTAPEVPEAFNYPDIPPQEYCDSLRYRRMRWIKTNTFAEGPIVLDIEKERGDGWWRQVTPFEFEILQKEPLHCTEKQLGPNLINTILKYDTEDTYRTFEIWWQCIDNNIEFIQGPLYKGNSIDAGDEKWTWDGETRMSDLLGTYFILRWTSSTPGYGTGPVTTIDDDVKNQLLEICAIEEDEELYNINDIIDEGTSTFNIATEGFPTFRVLYNCNTGKFEEPKVIGLSNPEDAGLRKADQWVYYDTFEDNNVPKCVYYFVGKELINISSLKQIGKIKTPDLSTISLVNCPCAGEYNVSEIINSIDDIALIISGVIGESSSVNRKYTLYKADINEWVSDEPNVDIIMTFNESINTFRISAKIIYNTNFNFTINQRIDSYQVFVSETGVSFSDAVKFSDANGNGTCSANMEGFVPLDDGIDLSSSSSESSSSSDTLGMSSSSSSSSEIDESSSSSSG